MSETEPRAGGAGDAHPEGLDELQGQYAADDWRPDADQAPATESGPTRAEPPAIDVPGPATAALWDQLAALAGRTLETAKGEAFAVAAVERGAGVTVTLLEEGQRVVVPGEDLEAAWALAEGGEELDRLAAIRLQQAGLAADHPAYVAGILHAAKDG